MTHFTSDLHKIYFTSDLHIGHDKEFLYGARGCVSVEEHNNLIINNINEICGEDDILYILGDLVMGDTDTNIETLKNIKCRDICIIYGNHDTNNRIMKYGELGYVCCGYASMIKYKKWSFYLSHYPTITTNYDADKPLKARVWNLCGHTHTQDKYADIQNGSYHVELDAHNNYPVSIDTIINDIREVYNENKIKRP